MVSVGQQAVQDRRLQRIFGHLGQHLQTLVQTPEFRHHLLNSRLVRPGVAGEPGAAGEPEAEEQ